MISTNCIVTPGDVSSHTSSSSPAQISHAEKLLPACWRSPDRAHFIGTLDRHAGRFKNISVKGAEEAAQFAQALSAMGVDAYFACAEFASPNSRSSQNAVGAWAFWADIDVAANKAATGQGYGTLEEAQAALSEFCAKAGLPEPTYIVASGSGIHCYWPFDTFLEREQWLEYAAKFKALMKALDLRADPSRTADLASVLRVPGTLNYKTTPPRPVTVLTATEELIELTVFLDGIDAAIVTTGAAIEAIAAAPSPAPHIPAPLHAESDREPPNVVAEKASTTNHVRAAPSLVPFPVDFAHEPPNIVQLASALKSLDPDCGEKLWKFYRIGPIACESRYFPELEPTLYLLTKSWSSGELRGRPSVKWNTPGSNGLTGAQFFDRVWGRFLTDDYRGKRVSLGSIFYHAKKLGWAYEPEQAGAANDNGTDAS